jgi:transcription initiation factor TFIIB
MEKQRLWNIFDTDNIQSPLLLSIEDDANLSMDPPLLLLDELTSMSHKDSSMYTLDGDSCATKKIIECDHPKNKQKLIESIQEHALHTCEDCDSMLVIMEDGFPTCTRPSCGRMYKNVLDHSPEWRFFGGGDKHAVDPTRCGGPINPLLVESSFGCKILCDSRSTYEMKKIKKWTEWQSCPHREKSLYEEFQFITTMAQNAGIPRIFIDSAMVIHKDLSEQKMFRGMNRDGIKAASIYLSCRLNGCPRTAHEIAGIFHLDRQSATYGCSTAVKILNNVERSMDPKFKTELATTKPSSFIERFCSYLHIPHELAMLAKFIASKVEQSGIICDDNTPQSSAAGIIYFVSNVFGLNIYKMKIKEICGVSEVTINKCHKKLHAMMDDLIPKCLLQKYGKL